MAKSNKKVSMQDIANRLDISKNAVSLALHNKSGVSEETRELVIRMAQKLNYSISGADSKNKQSNKILVIIPEYIRNDSFFYNNIYWAIENHSKLRGYTAILSCVSQEMQQSNQMPPIFGDIEFMGIIMVGVLPMSYVAFLQSKTSNIVSVDQYYNDLDIDCVLTANIPGSYKIAKYVIGQGHRKIGFAGSIHVTSSIYERWCGYQQAMMEANIPIDPRYSITAISELTSLLSNREEMQERLMELTEFPTAWICGGDRIAISLIEALGRMNIRVPEDVSVTGFDNIEASMLITPPMTTVNVKRTQMGNTAVDLLLQNADKEHVPSSIEISADVIVRSSVMKIN